MYNNRKGLHRAEVASWRLKDHDLCRPVPSVGFTTGVLLFMAEYNDTFVVTKTCFPLFLNSVIVSIGGEAEYRSPQLKKIVTEDRSVSPEDINNCPKIKQPDGQISCLTA